MTTEPPDRSVSRAQRRADRGAGTRLDIVAVVTPDVTTAMGGGIVRDVPTGDVPPAAFRD